MYDFLSSIGNIIGEYINKFLDFCFGKKKAEKTVVAAKSAPIEKSKPSAWVRKKK